MQAHPSDNLPKPLALWPEGKTPYASPEDGPFPRLTMYLPSPEHRTGASVLILPGGGYGLVSTAKEGHRPAMLFSAHGIAAAVLEYRHEPQRHPVPLLDAQRGIRVLRQWAEQHGLRRDRIGVMGFSAGGHLAGTAATQPDHPEGRVGDTLDAVSCRPDFAALIYPVVNLVDPAFAHMGSRRNLLGPDSPEDLARNLSVDLSVTPETPPMFLFHTQEDESVPCLNSIMLYTALTSNKVPSELHVYAKGTHGIGHAANHPWGRLLFDWIETLF